MAIQTAGEQKYYDFIEPRAKSVRTGMIIWISFFALALVAAFSDIILGLCFVLLGAIMAACNLKAQKELKGKLDGIEDKADFYNQLIAPDVIEIREYGLLIARDYVLQRQKKDVKIYALRNIARVETDSEGGRGRTLYLIGFDGGRQALATAGSRSDGDFVRIEERLRERVK